MKRAALTIREELRERIVEFERQGKLLEAQRIKMRTEYDLEMMEEMGNTPHIARAHYLDPPDEEAAAEFWAITPASVTESKEGK